MSLRALTMPRLGETMEEGRIVGWLVAPGESFRRGDPLLEIETDKTVAEFPALGDGRLHAVSAEPGDTVAVGTPIAQVEVVGDASWLGEEAAPVSEASAMADVAPAAAQDVEVAAADPLSHAGTGQTRATPVARRLARERGIDIASLAGTGRRGRVEAWDVQDTAPADDAEGLRFATLPAGRMAYLESGPGGGAPFLLLHGFAGDHATWSVTASGLARAGARVVRPDLPAHGRTAVEAADPEALGRSMAAFLDAVMPGDAPVEIVAHSLGAVAAVALAEARPDRMARLTLIAPAGIGPEIDAGFIHGMAEGATGAGVGHWLRRLSVRPSEMSAAALDALASTLAQGRLRALAKAVAGPGGQAVDITGALARLAARMPVRVLVGREDRIIPWQQATELDPRIAVHVLGASGHMPQWDRPREVLDILLSPGGARR